MNSASAYRVLEAFFFFTRNSSLRFQASIKISGTYEVLCVFFPFKHPNLD